MIGKHVLIVEDEIILYDKLATFLSGEGFSVDSYTPSVADAYERILEKRPDVVLLDINLKGEKTGVDLGKKLYSHFKIPFIYVTDVSDKDVFKEALKSMPNLYLLKTKPFLKKQELLMHIELVLNSSTESNEVPEEGKRHGIFLFTDRGNDLKEKNVDPNYRELVAYQNILFIEIDLHVNKFNKAKSGAKNYVRIVTRDEKVYFYNNSLSNILTKLPDSFVRLSRSVAVNLLKENVLGKTSQSAITLVNGDTIYIGNAYKEELEIKLKKMFTY